MREEKKAPPGFLEFLEELGEVSEELQKEVMEQKSLDILKNRFKLASDAKTLEEIIDDFYDRSCNFFHFCLL